MDQKTRSFILDFSQCQTWGEIYREIKKKLELPDWCGENLDALWDALTGIMHIPAHITVSKKVANPELTPVIEEILVVMHRAERTYHEITVIETE